MIKKRVLVTGGAGFIGSNFCDYMNKVYPDYELVVVDALTYLALQKQIYVVDENVLRIMDALGVIYSKVVDRP